MNEDRDKVWGSAANRSQFGNILSGKTDMMEAQLTNEYVFLTDIAQRGCVR